MASAVHFRDLPGLAHTHLGESRWFHIEQSMVTEFADLTGDRQWIHIDPKRAAAGPFGGPIAHGYFTLSLATALLWEFFTVDEADQTINYGLNKVRFPAPVPVGARLRLSADCTDVDDVKGGYQLTLALTFEIEHQPKPVCVAESLFRYYGSTGSLT